MKQIIKIIFINLLFLVFACIVDQGLRWDNTFSGIICGLLYSALFSIIYLLTILPLQLLLLWLINNRKLHTKYNYLRNMIIFSFPIFCSLLLIVNLIIDPPTDKGLFRRIIMKNIPESVTNIKSFSDGGFLFDRTYIIYFNIAPKDFEKILLSRPFESENSNIDKGGKIILYNFFDNIHLPVGFPEIESPIEYSYHSSNSTRIYRIYSNQEHSKIYFLVLEY